MRRTFPHSLILVGLAILTCSCGRPSELVVLHQVTGPVETNCYLVYDATSQEAALIDVGGPIDSLVTYIEQNDLRLKYIFATHCHMDHVEGVPDLQERFPDALLCYNQRDYRDFLVSREWLGEHFPEMVAEMKQSPEYSQWFEYDLSVFKQPDIYLEDNQTFGLGDLDIRTILTPGHSSGSICFHIGEVLFSGDVLFHRQVGRTDMLGGSKESIIASVRRLYRELPAKTKVYPGHGEFTDMGSEMQYNEEVTVDVAAVKN